MTDVRHPSERNVERSCSHSFRLLVSRKVVRVSFFDFSLACDMKSVDAAVLCEQSISLSKQRDGLSAGAKVGEMKLTNHVI